MAESGESWADAEKLLIQSVVDYAIYMLDPKGHIVSWNPGAERIKGYTAAEVIGTHFSRFYTNSWLRVSGTAKMPQIDQSVRHQLHTVVTVLFELETQQKPFEFVLPGEGPLHAEP